MAERIGTVSTPPHEGEGSGSSFSLVELNCENLFDCQHDTLKEDEAFLPSGTYRWTPNRYWKKLNHIGQEIISCGEQEDGSFNIPDLVALCEVENDSVLRDLTKRSLLRNARYEYIVTQSPDLRGIDVALLYSPFTFGVIATYPIRISPLKNMRPTRDILYVKGRTAEADTLHIFIVHAPSRSGGEYETRKNRMCVAERLIQSTDSIRAVEHDAQILVAGDFNDYNGNPSLLYIEQHELSDVSADAKGKDEQVRGTYKYQGKWDSLDHIFISPAIKEKVVSCKIGDAPFLLCKDEEYGGIQPLRNFNGVRWQDGFSDHLPLILQLSF